MDLVPPELQVEAPEGSCDTEDSNSLNVHTLVQQLRTEVTLQIEASVANVWQKGMKNLQQAQEKNAVENTALEAELRKFKERQEVLAQENRRLRAAMDSLVRCISGFCPVPSAPGRAESVDFKDFFTPAPSPASSAAAAAVLQENLLMASDPKLPVSKANDDVEHSSCQATFTFTLRKADGVPLGLDVSHAKGGRGLRVEKVQAGGAVEAWNRQCPNTGCEAENRLVQPGDMVVAVNNVSGEPSAMLNECRNKQLLCMTIIRAAQDKQAGPLPPGCSPVGLEFNGKRCSADHAVQKPFQFSKFGG